jgi:hypothetical protein
MSRHINYFTCKHSDVVILLCHIQNQIPLSPPLQRGAREPAKTTNLLTIHRASDSFNPTLHYNGRVNSRSLRHTLTIHIVAGSMRQTIRKGGCISSLIVFTPNSGTMRELSGYSASCSVLIKISRTSRSPTSGTCCSAYQARISSRSHKADSANSIGFTIRPAQDVLLHRQG